MSLEGFTSCPVSVVLVATPRETKDTRPQALDEHTSNFYASAEFTAKAAESATFLNNLKPFMDGRAVTLQNMVRKSSSIAGLITHSRFYSGM